MLELQDDRMQTMIVAIGVAIDNQLVESTTSLLEHAHVYCKFKLYIQQAD